jgi:hypothetical protein
MGRAGSVGGARFGALAATMIIVATIDVSLMPLIFILTLILAPMTVAGGDSMGSLASEHKLFHVGRHRVTPAILSRVGQKSDGL